MAQDFVERMVEAHADDNLLCRSGYVLTPLTKKVHQIESIDQPSKATGFVLPWTPIEYVVDACGLCAVDEGTDGE